MSEFVPMVDTDKIGYEVLAKENPGLIGAIRQSFTAGATAKQVERFLRYGTNLSGAVVDLAIGAAYYIEEGRDR